MITCNIILNAKRFTRHAAAVCRCAMLPLINRPKRDSVGGLRPVRDERSVTTLSAFTAWWRRNVLLVTGKGEYFLGRRIPEVRTRFKEGLRGQVIVTANPVSLSVVERYFYCRRWRGAHWRLRSTNDLTLSGF